jgi:AbrB family looped-hinge helix DNA binding protein
MSSSTISPKFQVVIPQDVRERVQLKAGTKVEVFALNGQIHLVPLKGMKALRGTLKLSSTDPERDESDREL